MPQHAIVIQRPTVQMQHREDTLWLAPETARLPGSTLAIDQPLQADQRRYSNAAAAVVVWGRCAAHRGMASANILKRTVYVGGLDEQVDRKVLEEAFVRFGELKTVEIPLDLKTGKHRGFGFVEFMELDDAQDAIDNMHHAELYGRVIKVNLARAPKNTPTTESNRPIWADDFFYRKKLKEMRQWMCCGGGKDIETQGPKPETQHHAAR
eukprot:s200_g17.t1